MKAISMCNAELGQCIDAVWISVKDFIAASNLCNYVKILNQENDRVKIETDRYSRRELTRGGISFSYRS